MPTYSDEDLWAISKLEGWQHAGAREMAKSWLHERNNAASDLQEPVAVAKPAPTVKGGVIVEWLRYGALKPGDKLVIQR